MDQILYEIKKEISYPQDANSTSLPDTNYEINPNLIFNLKSGKLYGLNSVKRIGNGLAMRSNNIVTINALVGFENLEFTYKTTASMGIGIVNVRNIYNPTFELTGSIDEVSFDLLLDLYASGNQAGQVFQLAKLEPRGMVNLQLKGLDTLNTRLLRYLVPETNIQAKVQEVIKAKIMEIKPIIEKMRFWPYASANNLLGSGLGNIIIVG